MRRIKTFESYSINEELTPELRNAAALKAAKLATLNKRNSENKYGIKNDTIKTTALKTQNTKLSELPQNVTALGKKILSEIGCRRIKIQKFILDTDPLKNGPGYGMKLGSGADAYAIITCWLNVDGPIEVEIKVLPDDIQIIVGENYVDEERARVIYNFCKRYLQPELKLRD